MKFTRAYRTASTEVLNVLTGIPPRHLTARSEYQKFQVWVCRSAEAGEALELLIDSLMSHAAVYGDQTCSELWSLAHQTANRTMVAWCEGLGFRGPQVRDPVPPQIGSVSGTGTRQVCGIWFNILTLVWSDQTLVI
ncbi:hypothetical protein AVEN_141202-1 [Araneus ventricosus]|uniref:Uncharacterized protein n=1 Tax=Araneus ventricosus TaxID=182803 RepID=A0A4Y2ESM5_ARAVE|nr:hypothetical protein AVEN_141202-1 [Araneus ventricosus]